MRPSTVQGVDFAALANQSQEEALRAVLDGMRSMGLQATLVGRGRALVQRMLTDRKEGDCVMLSYTSNLISSGLRDTFAYLAKERLVDCFISSAGGVEEDVIKCLGSTLVGKFDLDGLALRKKGVNRIGNLLVPNDNYCDFETYFMEVIKEMHEMQRESRWSAHTAPSDFIYVMGRTLEKLYPDACQSSLVYWCYKKNIPVFCPALTDGSMGDMLYFYNFSEKGVIVDPVPDVVKLRGLQAVQAGAKNSAIVLGAGLPKHQLLSNVRVARVVMVTTGIEADGCTSSCVLADDRACGLLREDTEVVRIQADATLVFPLLLVPLCTAAVT